MSEESLTASFNSCLAEYAKLIRVYLNALSRETGSGFSTTAEALASYGYTSRKSIVESSGWSRSSSTKKKADDSRCLKALDDILELDKKYQMVLDKIGVHQDVQKQIYVSEECLDSLNQCIVELAGKLSSVEHVMEQIVFENKEMLENIDNANSTSLTVQELIRYAHTTSYTAAAPPHWQPGAPLGPFSAPYPSEIQMRSGCLSNAMPEVEEDVVLKDVEPEEPNEKPKASEPPFAVPPRKQSADKASGVMHTGRRVMPIISLDVEHDDSD
eukprot:Nk52_evm17s352 gene=Nk52_evmTU17s352